MNSEEEVLFKQMEDALKNANSKNQMYETYYNQQNNNPQNAHTLRDQLDLNAEMEKIENLLRGKIRKAVKDEATQITSIEWVEPADKEMVILSDYGIHLILNTISWYINKNTLLSNYDLDTILEKMEDFTNDLTDTIFMEYEKVFQYPTLEECKTVLEERIKKQVDIKKFARELIGEEDIDEDEIKEKILEEMEDRIEHEFEVIKQQIIKNKLKRFLIIMREVQDSVHSTYLRAYMGGERKSLRQNEFLNINESRGIPLKKETSSNGLFGFLRKK